MKEIFEKINKKIIDDNIFDFEIYNLINYGDVTIIGSSDLGFYHEIELVFLGVSIIICSIRFFDDVTFRLATYEEKIQIKNNFESYDPEDIGYFTFCIEEKRVLQKVIKIHKNYIVAKDLKYNFDTVYHYKREKLEKGERIADWIK